MNVDKPSVRYLTVEAMAEGQRIDNYLLRQLKGLPKSIVYRILRKGEVRVNKGRVKPDYRVKPGDEIRVPPLRLATSSEAILPSDKVLQILAAAILFEDDKLIVLNKPSGLPVHGGSGLSYGVIEALRALRPHLEGLELVHRLDKETSGCLLLAKKRGVLKELHEMLRNGHMQKTYLALVKGRWPAKINLIDAPLLKNQLSSGERMVKVNPEQGKAAKTLFKPVEYYSNASLVEASPITGRTHQIRVHALHAGYPLAGDNKYGNEEFNQWIRMQGGKRLFLHAAKLSFQLPSSGQRYEFKAPLPAELQRLLTKLAVK
ncbi:MAG: pseudouridine synthase, RluA family [Gammaproteobacteria bacterium]|jgi:23S rRNA pseudouridine955/2504/2580 synthase|nr:pseudouridine synthase, RluA family [Gammaproteobacteria bacterium]